MSDKRRHTPIPSAKLINKWTPWKLGPCCVGKINTTNCTCLPRGMSFTGNICRLLMNTRIFNWFILRADGPFSSSSGRRIPFYIVSFSWHKCEKMGSQGKIMSALCHGMRRANSCSWAGKLLKRITLNYDFRYFVTKRLLSNTLREKEKAIW